MSVFWLIAYCAAAFGVLVILSDLFPCFFKGHHWIRHQSQHDGFVLDCFICGARRPIRFDYDY